MGDAGDSELTAKAREVLAGPGGCDDGERWTVERTDLARHTEVQPSGCHEWTDPAHLEEVTDAENARRGEPGLWNAARFKTRTHCKHGHELLSEVQS